MKNLQDIKAAHPHCANIIALIEHLHSGNRQPEKAAFYTLKWLGATAYNKYAHRMGLGLVLSGAQAAGKTFFANEVVGKIFGLYASLGANDQLLPAPDASPLGEKITTHKHEHLRIVDEFLLNDETLRDAINFITTGAWLPNKTLYCVNWMLITNQFDCPLINRHFLVAKCYEKISDNLLMAVKAEISNGGLFAFVEMLSQISEFTKDFPSDALAAY